MGRTRFRPERFNDQADDMGSLRSGVGFIKAGITHTPPVR